MSVYDHGRKMAAESPSACYVESHTPSNVLHTGRSCALSSARGRGRPSCPSPPPCSSDTSSSTRWPAMDPKLSTKSTTRCWLTWRRLGIPNRGLLMSLIYLLTPNSSSSSGFYRERRCSLRRGSCECGQGKGPGRGMKSGSLSFPHDRTIVCLWTRS